MRIGRNPLTDKITKGLPTRVMSVITHLPERVGYHEHRLEVVIACLLSMRNGAPDIPVMVWDNGSCADLTDWLQKSYKPDTLILSPNIGKSNARAALFRQVPGETIMSITDDDILFYPGWWDANELLLKTFPDVGKCSVYPVRTQARWGCDNTKSWARRNGSVEVGKFISEEEDFDFCTSIGRDYSGHLKYTEDDLDYRVTYNGLTAYCVAHHCQFMAYAGRIMPFCIRVDSCMHDEKPFDIAVDKAGLLQVTTTQRYARHIGNVIDKKVFKELTQMGLLQEVANG